MCLNDTPLLHIAYKDNVLNKRLTSRYDVQICQTAQELFLIFHFQFFYLFWSVWMKHWGLFSDYVIFLLKSEPRHGMLYEILKPRIRGVVGYVVFEPINIKNQALLIVVGPLCVWSSVSYTIAIHCLLSLESFFWSELHFDLWNRKIPWKWIGICRKW